MWFGSVGRGRVWVLLRSSLKMKSCGWPAPVCDQFPDERPGSRETRRILYPCRWFSSRESPVHGDLGTPHRSSQAISQTINHSQSLIQLHHSSPRLSSLSCSPPQCLPLPPQISP